MVVVNHWVDFGGIATPNSSSSSNSIPPLRPGPEFNAFVSCDINAILNRKPRLEEQESNRRLASIQISGLTSGRADDIQ
ncbi:hypothetical protein KIN20_006583 [Parelaphostrongylus tenuis]|uniref:Uncharacterized protein n=1 Tax=Parelaphostrongylus tenuis TaxID=148309 RepID=A0AAD5M1Z0_PARTN|nr:hypothetical protein KIN20_006583 [Parelaphostrongylus tenuis]